MSSKFGTMGTVSVEELNQRLSKDEEWLSGFQEVLGRSVALTESVCSLLDNFQERIDSLSTNVSTLVAKSSVIQKEQQSIRKLLSTVDATIQFHGKSTVLENTIQDGGNVLLNLDDYLEKMRNLKEAIGFFSTHPIYRDQLEHIKQIYEIGCNNIESEFGNLVRTSSAPMDPGKVFDCLDDDYEMPSFRMSSFLTLRETQRIHQMAVWLLDDGNCSQFLQFYAQIRAENMMKPLRAIADQISATNRCSKSNFVKNALKKVASRIADSADQAHRDNALAVVLFMSSTMLVLIQLETDLCAAVFGNVKVEADVLRQIIHDPLSRVLVQTQKVIDAYEGNFAVMILLAKFYLRHANQLAALSENIGQRALFTSLQFGLVRKCMQLIKVYLDRLSNDQIGGRFVPEDGNIHPVSSGTINFLKLLVQHQKLLAQIYQKAAEDAQEPKFGGGPSSPSKLFAQMLHALSANLRHKCGAYTDPHLGALFMFNNLGYIVQCCTKDKQLLASLQQQQPQNSSEHTQLLAGYEADAETYLKRYLESWARIGALFAPGANDWEPTMGGNERKTVKAVFTSFNRHFDAIIDAQKNYCLADQTVAKEVRTRIKDLVLRPFVDFSTRNSRECSELFETDRQLKYDAETVEMVIDRLFDATF